MRPPLSPLPTLYALRLKAGYGCQGDLAAHLGVCLETYARMERGKGNMRPRKVRRLAKLLRVKEAVLRDVLRALPTG